MRTSPHLITIADTIGRWVTIHENGQPAAIAIWCTCGRFNRRTFEQCPNGTHELECEGCGKTESLTLEPAS